MTLPDGKGKGTAKGQGEGERTSDESDNGSDDMDTYMSDAEEPRPMPTPAEPSPSPAAPRLRTARSPSPAVRPSRSTQGMIPAVPPMPATSTPSSSRPRPAVEGSTHQHPFLPNGNGNGSNNGFPPTPSAGVGGRRSSSFLRNASINNNTRTPAATAEDVHLVPTVLSDSRRNSETLETIAGPAAPGHRNGSGRQSFLDRGRVATSARDAAVDTDGTVNAAPGARNVGGNVAGQQEDEEPAAGHWHGIAARAQGRARIWALNW